MPFLRDHAVHHGCTFDSLVVRLYRNKNPKQMANHVEDVLRSCSARSALTGAGELKDWQSHIHKVSYRAKH